MTRILDVSLGEKIEHCETLFSTGRWREMLGLLFLLEDEALIPISERLRDRPLPTDNETARQLWESGGDIARFKIWARSPIGYLVREAAYTLLVELLDNRYLEVAHLLAEFQDSHSELLSLWTPRHLVLEQWVSEFDIVLQEGEAHWQLTWLLNGKSLPLDELLPFFEVQRLLPLVDRALTTFDLRDRLSFLLEHEQSALPLTTEPRSELEETFLRIFQRRGPSCQLLRAALKHGGDKAVDLWRAEPYPALLRWIADEGSVSTPPPAQRTQSDELWLRLCDLPLYASGAALATLGATNYRPSYRPDLYDKMTEEASRGPLRCLKLDWRDREFRGDRLYVDGEWIFVGQSEKGRLTGLGPDGESVFFEPFETFRGMRGVWRVPDGFIRHGDKIVRHDDNGYPSWTYDGFSRTLAFSPNRRNFAFIADSGLTVCSTDFSETVGHAAFPDTSISRTGGPAEMPLDWSPCGRWITSAWANYVFVWDATTLEHLQTLKHQAAVSDVVFTEQTLVVSISNRLGNSILLSYDRCVLIWNPETGERLHQLTGLESAGEIFPAGRGFLVSTKNGIVPLEPNGLNWSAGKPLALGGWMVQGFIEGLALCKNGYGENAIVDGSRGEVLLLDRDFACWEYASGLDVLVGLRDSRLLTSRLWDERSLSTLPQDALSPSARRYQEWASQAFQ